MRADHAQDEREGLNEGIAFFNKFILAPGQIDEETRKKVIENDPEVYIFVITRALYLYIFGEERNAKTPSFFKNETRNFIRKLRNEFKTEEQRQEKAKILAPLMNNFKSFETLQNIENQELFNRLRNMAYNEFRIDNALFITQCWGAACNAVVIEM